MLTLSLLQQQQAQVHLTNLQGPQHSHHTPDSFGKLCRQAKRLIFLTNQGIHSRCAP